ncbi:hypothetical protein YW7DRAFT_06985 [Streptomyces sp. AmelKG-E11A]|nr:hypothetical protein YW7DRAFT_06985 [Streptomyces sp. AmelKG-E11A]
MTFARVGIGFEDNPTAALVLGAVVPVVSFVLGCWRCTREGKQRTSLAGGRVRPDRMWANGRFLVRLGT